MRVRVSLHTCKDPSRKSSHILSSWHSVCVVFCPVHMSLCPIAMSLWLFVLSYLSLSHFGQIQNTKSLHFGLLQLSCNILKTRSITYICCVNYPLSFGCQLMPIYSQFFYILTRLGQNTIYVPRRVWLVGTSSEHHNTLKVFEGLTFISRD